LWEYCEALFPFSAPRMLPLQRNRAFALFSGDLRNEPPGDPAHLPPMGPAPGSFWDRPSSLKSELKLSRTAQLTYHLHVRLENRMVLEALA